MIIGGYTLNSVDTGRFALDGGAMFGVVPKPLWEKAHPADDRNRIAMAARALLLVGHGRTILVDTGNGDKYDPKQTSIFGFDTSSAGLLASLNALGVAPGDVTDVLLTHLHFDHAGGATRIVNGVVEPTFPGARYHVQKAQWDTALQPTERDRASFFPHDYLPLQARDQLLFVQEDEELFPGIRLLQFHGHTTALQCPLLSDGTTTLLYCADLVPLHSHVQLPWIMGYDLRPLVTLEEKRQVLRQAADEQWILFFEHDPDVIAARIGTGPKGYVITERMKL